MTLPVGQSRKTQIDELYRLLGRYLVEYQQTQFWLKTSLTSSLSLTASQQPIFRLLAEELSDKGFNRAIRNIIFQLRTFQPDEKKIISFVCNELDSVEARRNAIIHGTFFIGWGNENTVDWSKASRTKPKGQGEKRILHSEELTATELKDEIRKIFTTGQLANRMLGSLFSPDPKSSLLTAFTKLDSGAFEPSSVQPPCHDLD